MELQEEPDSRVLPKVGFSGAAACPLLLLTYRAGDIMRCIDLIGKEIFYNIQDDAA